jgi:predicted transcriptional regulator
MENLCDILFEVSNEDRLRILKALQEEPRNLTPLARKLGLSTQEASRHAVRLSEVGLAAKDSEGLYTLTPYGRLTLSQLRGIEFTSHHKDYFNAHTAEDLPSEYGARLGELSGATPVDDVMVVIHNIERMIREAEEYIWRLTDRYLMMALPDLEEAVNRGVEFRLMRTRDFEFPPDWPGEGVILREARLRGQFQVRASDSALIFIAMSEKAVAALAFPSVEGRFDYLGFTSSDEESHRWCRDLYLHYWDSARVPESLRP